MAANQRPVEVIALTATVKGSSGKHYTVYRANDGAWVCECPAWRNQANKDPHHRSCKHLVAVVQTLGQHVVAALA